MTNQNFRDTHYKECAICGETKRLTEFHRNGTRKDGMWAYLRRCKPCYKQTLRPPTDDMIRRRQARHRRYARQYRAANPDKVRAEDLRHRQKFPGRYYARQEVHKAVLRGELMKASDRPCHDCGLLALMYDHYRGYAPEHALDVQPVCGFCHGRRDRDRGEHKKMGDDRDRVLAESDRVYTELENRYPREE
jgi:hypothetical protein